MIGFTVRRREMHVVKMTYLKKNVWKDSGRDWTWSDHYGTAHMGHGYKL